MGNYQLVFMSVGTNLESRPAMNKPPDPPTIRELVPTTAEVGATKPTEIPTIVEAPVLVVPPGTATSVGGDANTGGGGFVGRDVATSTSDTGQRFSSSGSNVTFSREDNSKLWESQMKLLQDIANVAYKLNGLPDDLMALTKYVYSIPLPVPIVVPLPPVIAPVVSSIQGWLLVVAINLIVLLGAAVIWLLVTR